MPTIAFLAFLPFLTFYYFLLIYKKYFTFLCISINYLYLIYASERSLLEQKSVTYVINRITLLFITHVYSCLTCVLSFVDLPYFFLVFFFFWLLIMQNADLYMGSRPSRQRRHLPTAITSSVTEKRPANERGKRLSLLKMTFGNDSQKLKDDSTKKTTASKRSKGHDLKKSSKRKTVIWFISILWLLFILFRVLFSFKQQNFGYLSLVHFISNLVNARAT